MTSYRVTGATPFHGHLPGEEFTADLDEAQERRAVERGSIEKVGKKPAKPKTEEEDDE